MLVAGGVLGSSFLTSCGGAASSGPKKHIGLQLYSLRDPISDLGIKRVLELVAEMGYVNLEGANYNRGLFYGEDPVVFKRMVSDLGMRITSTHLERALSDDRNADMSWWSTATEACAATGLKHMVIPMAPLSGEGATMDNLLRHADYFNAVGLITAGSSIKLGYHNHAFEFTNTIDGVTVMDLLVEHTSPRHVSFQNDVNWTQRAGVNPVELLRKYPDRINTLHIKDEKTIGGSGTMNFKAIFEQAYANGVVDWYVEVEEYDTTALDDVRKSAEYLIAADYVI